MARGYHPTTAARTVERARELGYVGDERLAHDRARALRARGAGSLRIVADLVSRGVPEALAEQGAEASRDGESETVWARRALARAGGPRGPKAWRGLATHGFPEDVVAGVVDDD